MADAYPPYRVTLKGLGKDHVMTGTHTGAIVASDPELEVTLTHPDRYGTAESPGLLDLVITFAKKPKKA